MVKIGLWLELEVRIGFMVGLGLGSLTGQRTVATILLIVLEIIVTPILAAPAIPYFLDGQRLDRRRRPSTNFARRHWLRRCAEVAPGPEGWCSAGGVPWAFRRCRPGR